MATKSCEVLLTGVYNSEADKIQWQLLTGLTLTNDEEVVVSFFALNVKLPDDYVISKPRKLIVNLHNIATDLDHLPFSTI